MIRTLIVVLVLPVLLIGFYSYTQEKRSLTRLTMTRRESVAFLAAQTLKSRLDHLVQLASSLAGKEKFKTKISRDKWDEAAELMSDVPRDFPYVDRLILTDPDGILQASVPFAQTGRGKSLAFRDWYRGVRRRWEPYISEVYKKSARSPAHLIAVAVPIKKNKDKAAGVLVLQLKLDNLFTWVGEIEVGPSGYFYFVNKKGQVVLSPRYPPEGEIIDYSEVPVVQKVIEGERGVEVLFNPVEQEEMLSAYVPVARYGWGVIAEQPAEVAFADRDKSLVRLLILYGMVFLINCFLVYLVRTLTERKRAQEDLKKSNEALQRLNQIKSDFASMISHELRTPLNSIKEGIGIVLDGLEGPVTKDQSESLGIAKQNVDRMARLIDDILNYARLESGKMEMVFKKTELKELLTEVCNFMKPAVSRKQVDFQLDLPDRPVTLLCDADKIRQVVINLIHNALKFTPDEGHITVRLGLTDFRVRIDVEDTGAGIPKKDQEKIFEMFRQASSGELRPIGGSGIGLAVCKLIVDGHRGKISVESEPGRGSRFSIVLPLIEPEESKGL